MHAIYLDTIRHIHEAGCDVQKRPTLIGWASALSGHVALHKMKLHCHDWHGILQSTTYQETGVIVSFPQPSREAAIQMLYGPLLQNGLLALHSNVSAHPLHITNMARLPSFCSKPLNSRHETLPCYACRRSAETVLWRARGWDMGVPGIACPPAGPSAPSCGQW